MLFAAAFVWHAAAEPVDHGYLRYLAVADEMLRSGDWVVQRLDGRIYLDKPPLFPWLVALPGLVLGRVPGWGQHAVNGLAALLLVGWTAAAGRRLFGRIGPGLTAAAVALTAYRAQVALHDERLDLFFAALLTGSLVHLHVALTESPPGRRRALAFGLAGLLLGGAVLTKGPVALGFALPALLLFAASTGHLRALASRDALAAPLVLLVVVLPWPLLLLHRLGSEGLSAALESTRLVTRFQGVFHYVLQFPSELAPWSLFLPAAVAAWIAGVRPSWSRSGRRFVGSWILAMLVVLQLSGARHSRYLLPLFPALALWMVSLWADPDDPLQRSPARWLRSVPQDALLAVLAAVSAAGLIGLPWVPAPAWLVGPVALAVAAIAGGTLATRPRAPMRRLHAAVACSLLVWAGLDSLRALDFQREPCWPGAERALAALPAHATLSAYGLDESGRIEVSLAARRPVARVRGSALGEAPLHPDGAWVVTTGEGSTRLLGAGVPAVAIDRFCLHREGRVLLHVAPGAGAAKPGARSGPLPGSPHAEEPA